MWSSWNQALHARCCTSASATALMMMSLNEIFPPSSPSCLLSASRASAPRSMSTSVVRKKCGIGPIDAARRFAIVLRIWVRGTSSYGVPEGAGSGERGAGTTARACVAPASTSRLMTRPPGPEPWTSLRSTPASFAIRFASGEALTRVASAGAAGAGAGAVTGAGVGGLTAPCSRLPAPAVFAAPGSPLPVPSTFSPGFPIHATTLPTGTVVPSGTMTFSSCPSARATNSMTALSVSTSASVSPDFTGSPSCFVHFTRRPSSIVGDSASMWTLVAMALLEVQHAARGGHDLLGRRLGGAFEKLVVGHGHVSLSHALHRRVEVVERVALNEIHDLRTDSGVWPPFLDDDRAVGLLDRFENRGFVQRAEGSQVEHLSGHVLLGELIGRLLGNGEGLGVADERDIGPLALDVRTSDRDNVLAVGDVALQIVQHLALEHDDRIVVADRGLEEPLGIGRRRWRDDLETGDVREPAFPRLRVLRGELECGAVRAAEHDRQGHLPARHVQHLGGGIHDLVERQDREIPRHELDDWAQPAHRGTHADPGEPQLGDRRVDDTFGAELLQQPLIQGVPVGERRHQSTSTSV